MDKELKKIKEDWDYLYEDEKLNEKAVLKEIYDYDFILKEVPKVYCEITGGLLSKPNYRAEVVLAEFNERFCDKKDIQADIRDILKSNQSNKNKLEEIKEYLELTN